MKIFEANEKEFKTNGLGNIDVFKCYETKKKSLNGWFIEVELSSKYSELIKESYLACIETKEKGIQPFRICNVNRTDKTISFTAKHVVFDTENYLLDDVRPTNLMCYNFLKYLNTRLDSPTIFTVNSNISTSKTAYFIRKSFLEALSEAEALFNGTFDIDKFDISLNTTVNNISSETLIYGKNIQSMKVYENWDNVCTKILPVGPNEIMLPEKYLVSDVQYEKPYTRSITFSIETKKENGEDKTSSEIIIELRQLATQYLNDNKYPLLNYTVSSDVEQSLKIGDIIHVKHPLATFQTEVQEYRYNCLTKRIESVIFGNYERSVQKAFSEIKEAIKKSENQSVDFLKEARDDVYYLMNIGGKNGSVVFKKNNSGVISELFFIDTNDIETAKTVMRINNQGVGGSTTGINGPYNSAIMANGNIVADAIKSGTIQAIDIKGVNITGSTINGISGKIGGFDIGNYELSGRYNRRLPDYTTTDLQMIVDYIMGKITLTDAQYNYLNVYQDGYLSSRDYNIIKDVINGKLSKNWYYNYKLKSNNSIAFIEYDIDMGGGIVKSDCISLASISLTSFRRISDNVTSNTNDIWNIKTRVDNIEYKMQQHGW